ncbi:hypothetical protein JTB14_016124 [Gonioctena quinquepunctata]|nr:hypothetical protein JTB14_016124 [Gonioctena quinquepunctata]
MYDMSGDDMLRTGCRYTEGECQLQMGGYVKWKVDPLLINHTWTNLYDGPALMYKDIIIVEDLQTALSIQRTEGEELKGKGSRVDIWQLSQEQDIGGGPSSMILKSASSIGTRCEQWKQSSLLLRGLIWFEEDDILYQYTGIAVLKMDTRAADRLPRSRAIMISLPAWRSSWLTPSSEYTRANLVQSTLTAQGLHHRLMEVEEVSTPWTSLSLVPYFLSSWWSPLVVLSSFVEGLMYLGTTVRNLVTHETIYEENRDYTRHLAQQAKP